MDMNLRVSNTAKPGPEAAPRGKEQPAGGKELPAARRPEPTAASVADAVAQIQSYLKQTQRELNFQVDSGSGRTVIRVLNPNSGELIRQIPSEEMLKIAASIEAGNVHLLDDRS